MLFKALRAVFRAVPMGEPTRDALRSRFLQRFPSLRPLPAPGQAVPASERRPRVRADERCIGYVEYSEEPLPDPLPATLVAFYLPQFHTIPENDQWWGKGFTEWRNVTRALPQFEGHVQPRLPGDLGFYDLRNPEVMRDQAKLAKTYGLSAFCFYFYWFGGKTLLEEPLRRWLNDKSIDFRYCLCWANENWTRRWDGREDDVLIAQSHSPEDDLAFIEHVAPYLRDPRCLRVDGRPVLLLYRPMLLPDAKATAARWRTWCRENGIGEIHLAYVQSFERPDPGEIGFDAAVEFPPNLDAGIDLTARQRLLNPDYQGAVKDWRLMARAFAARAPVTYPLHRGVNCGWDNEPRRPGAGRTYIHATPAGYADWLRAVSDETKRSSAHPLIFINAWNEWAEGAVLEPDMAWGAAWLEATRAALRPPPAPRERPCIVLHAWYPDIAREMLEALPHAAREARLCITTTPCRVEAVRAVVEELGLKAEIYPGPNRGRDLLPFLVVAQRLLHEGETLVLKLHTKRSPHRADGDAWRRELLEGLASPEAWTAAVATFRDEADVGLLAPRHHVQPVGHFWGANEQALVNLAARLGLTIGSEAPFVSGSMFWARLPALRPLLDAPLRYDEFEPEAGQIDGTLAHAVERLIGQTVRAAGYRVLGSDRGSDAASSRYRYAAP